MIRQDDESRVAQASQRRRDGERFEAPVLNHMSPSPPAQALLYRPDIDGLRAIAVVVVLFFHTAIPGFTGGYVGVDIFFVISGYLITSIIWRELLDGRFSLLKFYERRVRRLLPALFVVLLATAAVGGWLLLPMEFRDFGRTLIAVAGFASNILFFKDTGYFDGPAELKPLLHTWSLAVEEQFYFFFPLLLLLAAKRMRQSSIVWLVVGLGLVSLFANVLLTPDLQSAAFYLLPFRAWELLLGAAIAFGLFRAPRRSLNTALAILGFCSIAVATFGYTSETQFPGIAAVLPCLGAALIICTGACRQGVVYDVLSSSPLVFIGRISYSLYLWHWPVVVYVKYWSGEDSLQLGTALAVIASSILLAIFSYYFVEQPFRSHRGAPSRRMMFAGAVGATSMWLGIGGAAYLTNGLPARLSDEVVRFASAAEDFYPAPTTCGKWSGDTPESVCVIGTQDQTPTFLMWGDSHAGILVHGLEAAAIKHGVSGLFSGIGGCPPLIGVAKDENTSDAAIDGACEPHNAALLKTLEEHPEISTVILVSRWAYYAAGEGVGPESSNKVRIWTATSGGALSAEGNDAVFRRGLTHTLAALESLGRRVFLVEQVPELDGYTSAKVARELARSGTSALGQLKPVLAIERDQVEHRQRPFTETVAAWLSASGVPRVTVLNTRDFFCDEIECRAVAGELPLYFDNNHVTTSTALALEKIYEPIFAAEDVRS